MNKEIMRALGFGEAVDLVENLRCPICRSRISIEDFRDELSKREFEISGLCQFCQDITFNCVEE